MRLGPPTKRELDKRFLHALKFEATKHCESGKSLKDALKVLFGCFSMNAPKMHPRCAKDALKMPQTCFSLSASGLLGSILEAFRKHFGCSSNACRMDFGRFWEGFRRAIERFYGISFRIARGILQQKKFATARSLFLSY